MKLYVLSMIAAMATQAHADLNPVPTTCTIACGGSSNACKGSTQPADVSETHPIRCCSDVEKPGWMKRDRCDIWSQTEIDGVCHSAVTFFEAVVICAKAGGGRSLSLLIAFVFLVCVRILVSFMKILTRLRSLTIHLLRESLHQGRAP